MYKAFLFEAEDDAQAAYEKADDNWQRMKSAYRTREAVVRALWEIGQIHELRSNRCKCNKRECKVADILARRTVDNLISEYDRRQERLERARRADEDAWLDEWDDLDPVSEDDDYGVYRRPARRASGREAG